MPAAPLGYYSSCFWLLSYMHRHILLALSALLFFNTVIEHHIKAIEQKQVTEERKIKTKYSAIIW